MSVIALCSAKGSPGVTTTAMLLAALWPRPVLLVDADPAGGDVALRLPGPDGRPLDTGRGLLTLLPLARRELAPSVLMDHAQQLSGGTPVLAGLGSPEQAGAVGALWRTLAEAFAGADFDVIVDAGRVHSDSVHLPVLRQADLVATVLRPTVTGVVHGREHLRHLGPALRQLDGSGPLIGVLTVHEVRGDDAAREAVAAVQQAAPGIESFGQIAYDTATAGMFDGLRVKRPERSMLIRSGRQVAVTLAEAVVRPAFAPPQTPQSPQSPQNPEPPQPGVQEPKVIDLREGRFEDSGFGHDQFIEGRIT